jgi:hypothetical protein
VCFVSVVYRKKFDFESHLSSNFWAIHSEACRYATLLCILVHNDAANIDIRSCEVNYANFKGL